MFLVVFTGIFEFKTLRQVVVHLNGTELPTATEGVFYHEVQLRTVESSLAGLFSCRQVHFLTCLANRVLCVFPDLVGTDVFLVVVRVAKGYLRFIVLEVEGFEDDIDDLHDADELLLYLVLTAEDMGIVLRKGAHTRQAVQLAALFVAINGTELRTAERQILVTLRAVLVDRAVVRAVHRLEHIDLAFLRRRDRLEGVLAVVIPVTGSHIQLFGADMRGDHLLVAVPLLDFLEEIFESQTEGSTFRQPNRQTFSDHIREHKEFQFFSDFTVVSFLRFFEQGEVFIQHRFLGEGDTIDTGHHRSFFITTPISGRAREHFHCLDGLGREQVRTAA